MIAMAFKIPSFRRPSMPQLNIGKSMAKVYRDIRIAQSKHVPLKYRVKVRGKPESGMSKAMREFSTFMRGRRGGVVLAPGRPKIPKFKGFEKPARGRIEISEGKSKLEILKEISETTDIARKKALETKLAGLRPVSRRGQPVEDWGAIWKKSEVETAKRIKAGKLQVQEMAGGELELLQITKVKAPKIKTIDAAIKKQAQYQKQIQKQIQKQRAFAVPIYAPKQVQIQKEIAKQSQIYKQQYKFEAVQVAAQKSVAGMKEEAAQRIGYVGITEYKVASVEVPKMVEIMEYAPMIKYKVPVVSAVIMPQPPIVPLLLYKPPKKKKVKKPKYKREPYAWIVKNPIPNLQQMMHADMTKAMKDMEKAQSAKPSNKRKSTKKKKR